MMDLIWAVLLAAGVGLGIVSGRPEAVTGSLLRSAEGAVGLVLGLVGIIALWSGMMRVAQEAGLPGLVARVLRPLLARLFPDLPKGHPALEAVAMSLGANLLGLGNASTPLGLRAMAELQKLNPEQGRLSRAQGTFLALVMGGLTLVPATVIALRARARSAHPAAILAPTLCTTLAGTITALCVDRVALRLTNRGKGPSGT
ncbi:MAG: nucleoside recognition domain-containing protein [Patescibacteria group bacterium]